MQKDMLFKETENYYEYSSNNPINKIDPFGLMPPWLWHWVQLRLPSPGGGAWVDRCEWPSFESDCYTYCSNKEDCDSCCSFVHRDDEDRQGYRDCRNRCP